MFKGWYHTNTYSLQATLQRVETRSKALRGQNLQPIFPTYKQLMQSSYCNCFQLRIWGGGGWGGGPTGILVLTSLNWLVKEVGPEVWHGSIVRGGSIVVLLSASKQNLQSPKARDSSPWPKQYAKHVSIQTWDFVITDFLVIVSPFQLHQISALGHSILPQLHWEMSVDQLNFCWPLWRRSVTETAFIITSVACAVGPSVPASSTNFSFLVFWIYLNFQQQKSL
jgi:hypothetical protein